MERQDLLATSSDRKQITVSAFGWEAPDSTRVVPTFMRQQYWIYFVLSGTGYLKNSTTEYRLTAGSGFIVFPGTVPSYYPAGAVPNYHPALTEPWEYFWVKASGAYLERLIKQSGITRQTPCFHLELLPDAIRETMDHICQSVVSGSQEQVTICFRNVFETVRAPRVSNEKNDYFNKCLEFIHDHYAEELTIQQIARYAAIDRTYLYKLFKKNLNCSPQTYLIDYRISEACRLLRSTKHNIADIAYAVGFQDLSNFSLQFRKRLNMTPTRYRSWATQPARQSL